MARSWGIALTVMLGWASRGDPPSRLEFDGRGGGGLSIAGVALPGGVMARPDAANPILAGKNLYAPDLVRNGESWNLYYGGWRDEADRNDRIYAAVCAGPSPAGPWAGREVIIDRGPYLHVNDPSVQKRGPGDWWMAFTAANHTPDGYRDWIAIASSRDGMAFTPRVAEPAAEIVVEGAAFTSIARPSLLWTGLAWRLWFDGKVARGPMHSYAAECADDVPRRFRLVHEYADVEGFPGFMEPDVAMVGGRYHAVVQRQFRDLRKLVSRDGVHFEDRGLILSSADPALGRRQLSNPGLIQEDDDKLLGVAFGMTDEPDLSAHAIGVAYHQYAVKVESPGDVGHIYAKSRGPDVALPMTFGFAEFTRITVLDPATREIVADRQVESSPGDRWRRVAVPRRLMPDR